MPLPSNQLEAFIEVARVRSFSRAAKNLHLTQSALSQRVLNLERTLGLSLFVRDATRLRLTPAGECLLRHCQVRESLEAELMYELNGAGGKGPSGKLRIGGFSSVMWSVIVPALGKLIRANPQIVPEFLARELDELPALLRSGEVDFAILDRPSERPGVVSQLLGIEENVLVTSEARSSDRPMFLDHDMEDQTTFRFFRAQGQKNLKLERFFMDDIHGIIAGVCQGWGSAVIPRHLVKHCVGVRVVGTHKSLRVPVYLHYYEQAYFSKLHALTVETLTQNCKALLAPA